MNINIGRTLTDNRMSTRFFADHRGVTAQEHGHGGRVVTRTLLGILIHCTPVDGAVFALIANSVSHLKLCVLLSSKAGVPGKLLDGVIH